MARNDYTSITELPASLLTPDQIHRFAHRYGYAHRLAQGKRLLEVACGSGSGLNHLAQSAAQVIGSDYSSGVLTQARQDTYVPLVQADAQWLPITATSARQNLINALRRWVITSGLLPWLEPMTTLLQHLSYGQLYISLPPLMPGGSQPGKRI